MSYWIYALLIGVAFLGGAYSGFDVARLKDQADASALAASQAQADAAAARTATSVLQGAQARGDALTIALLHSQTQVSQLQKAAHAAITQATTGRTCLDEPALRVLDTAPGLSVAGLPQAGGGAAATGGATATDTDISGWAIDAGAAYETCRSRLDALIDFFDPPEPAPHADQHHAD
jgi:hypothetical protein